MSIHQSLKLKSGASRSRNVWKRVERLESLEKSGKRAKGDSIYGLPKVRTRMKVKKLKSANPAGEKAAAPAAAAAAGAKPAAGAKAAAGAKPAAGAKAAAPAAKPAAKK